MVSNLFLEVQIFIFYKLFPLPAHYGAFEVHTGSVVQCIYTRVPGIVHCIPGTCDDLHVLYMLFSVSPLKVHHVVYCTPGTCGILQVLYMLFSVPPAHAAHAGPLEVHAAVHAGAGGLGEGGGVGHHWTLCHSGLKAWQGHKRYTRP